MFKDQKKPYGFLYQKMSQTNPLTFTPQYLAIFSRNAAFEAVDTAAGGSYRSTTPLWEGALVMVSCLMKLTYSENILPGSLENMGGFQAVFFYIVMDHVPFIDDKLMIYLSKTKDDNFN